MEKISLFGKKESRGTFEDFYDSGKYNSIKEAYEENDYVSVDFVKDECGILYFEFTNPKHPETKKYHRLNIQRPLFGIDVSDDDAACEIAATLFIK